jgi:hypothetical protein
MTLVPERIELFMFDDLLDPEGLLLRIRGQYVVVPYPCEPVDIVGKNLIIPHLRIDYNDKKFCCTRIIFIKLQFSPNLQMGLES